MAPDAREEVRWAVRRIIRAAQDGTPFHRTAIFYRQAAPYASLIQEQLALAGVSAAGPGALSLAGTTVGRSLLGLVRLGADGRFPRDAVTAWLTGGALAPRSVPRGEWQPARWDALSRRAGVVGGLAQWQERLERYAGELERQAGDGAAGEELSDAAARRLRGDARAARALAAFVADLGVRLRPPGDGRPWRDFADWARNLLEHYLPRARALSGGALPDVEAEALGRIERGLDEVAALDALAAPASLPRFTLALDDLLAAPAGRLERFGHGVFVAPLDAAPGLEFDLVHVAGMVEGAVPPPTTDDPLLPDEARRLAGGAADGLPLRGAQPADERYAYLAALATAPCRILSFPCADPGARRRQYPSRWVLEAASRLEGAPVGSSALAALGRRPWLTVVASMEGGLAAIPQTAEADLHDHDVYRLWHWRQAGRPLPAHHLAASAPLGRAVALERLRAAGEYCEWTGDLSALAATAGRLRPLDGALLSATSLEDWATCPFRYFLGHVLGVEALERPEEIASISALERGTLVHGILRRFVEQVQQDRTLPGPGEPWTDAHRALLVQLARDAFAEAEGRGVTGRALLWEAAKAEVLTDLEAFLDEDARLRARYGVAPHRVELRFGVEGDEQASPAPVWETPALGPIRFRGAIDRVDLDPAGRLALVLDYKTGKLDAYDGLERDPVDRGRRLQLPIYALAARTALGDHVRVLAAYWFVGARGGFALRPPDPVDLEAVAVPFGAAVSTIADGISRGLFPANPGKEKRDSFEHCQWCDFDPVCGARARRGRLWERLQADPRLGAYVRLAGAPAQDETLFVEAGAGTGKTTSLVARAVNLVATGRAVLTGLAAITFTEAAVETLHAFAGRLLRGRPLEAGLPPAFETLDEIAAELRFEEARRRWLDTALDDPARMPVLRQALALGLSLPAFDEPAAAFHRNYDLLEAAVFPDARAPEPGAAAALVEAAPALERLCAFAKRGEGDPLVQHVRPVLALARRLGEVGPDSTAAWRLLAQSGPIRAGNRGRQSDWDRDLASGQNACTRVKTILTALDGRLGEALGAARQAALAPLLRAVREFVLGYAAERKRAGVAEFHDLLVWARDLVRDHLVVRDHFRGRYTHLLLDECQDTDPLQAEIALFLAEDAAPGAGPQARPRGWTRVRPAPGKLFAVGDPKQSIYRFRRADVAVTARFRDRLGPAALALVQSFRAQRSVIAWVNHLFAGWMAERPGQVAYAPLEPRWEPRTDHPRPPAVRYLGGALEVPAVGPVRRQEAEHLAAALRQVHAEGWPVLDLEATRQAGEERFRPARWDDVCILLPRRTALRMLELALEDAGVPYRLEGTSLVLETQEVRELLSGLRAIDDPADQVALVAALRSPAFACSDADLLAFVESGGRLDYLSPGRQAAGVVTEAMAALRRYRFLADRARAFAEAAEPSLRAFLAWIERQADEGARVVETPAPEADEDAVRVMTVHAAKGLEFPIVVLTGLNTDRRARDDRVLFERETGRVEVRLGPRDAAFETPGYEALAERERRFEDEEAIRLMYVAATRARDHLLVSLYRKAGDATSLAARIAAHLDGQAGLWEAFPAAPVAEPPTPLPAAGAAPSPTPAAAPHAADPAVDEDTPEARDAWQARRAVLIRERARPAAVAATALAAIAKEEAGDPEEPWRRGRGGTSLGRAVHAVLQTVDLASGAGLEAAARAQATAERIPHRDGEVAGLVRAALESAAVRRAVASGRLWREVPVAVPVGAGVLEGFVDLLFEEPDGLVVADYKTDALETEEDVAQAMGRYRLQAGAYALAVQQATGRPVKEVVLLFLRPRREVVVREVGEMAVAAREAAEGLVGSTR